MCRIRYTPNPHNTHARTQPQTLATTVEELAEEGDEESAIRLCHASEDVAEQVSDLCETFGWDICEEADIFDYGEDTGCRSGSPTAREGFEVRLACLRAQAARERAIKRGRGEEMGVGLGR